MVALSREEAFVVIEIGSYVTKAMRDISDVNKLPTVHIRTRAGVLRPEEGDTPTRPGSAAASNEAMQVDAPGATTPPAAPKDSSAAEGADCDEPGPGGSAGASDRDDDAELGGASYVFGSALESADSSSLERTVDIMPDGFVSDWDALSAFLRHIVTKELGIRISDNPGAFLFSVPA
ncbi:hypothetical protein H4R19_007272, partial [Coemansia spiralis]